MSKDAKNVPALRFRGYSDAWEKRKLGELAKVRTGRAFKSSSFSPNGKYYVVTNKDIGGPQISTHMDGDRIDITNPVDIAKYSLSGRNLLVTMDGVNIGKTAMYSNEDAVLAQRVGRLTSSSLDFVHQITSQKNFLTRMNELSVGNAIKHISLKQISDYAVNVPQQTSERQLIGQTLSLLDNLIAATQDKLSFLKKMKMFFLQQIFPTKDHDVPQIRFDGFTDAWSHYKLGSLMRIDKEQEVKKELLTDIQKGFYVLAMRTFSMDGYIDHSKPYWLNCLDNVSDDKFLLPREFAILDADMDANLPKIGRVLLNASSEKYLLAAHVRKIQVKSGNDPIFIYALMRGNSVHERLKLEANGSISKRLLDKNVYKQSILVPNRSEQSKIGRLFFLLETTITLHQQKIQMLKQVKKSCLQNLFI